MSLRPAIVVAALLITACGGSLIDHLGFDANPPPAPDAGGGNPDGGGNNQCTAPQVACSQGCCLGASQVGAGGSTSCAIVSDNTVRCWGTTLGATGSSAAPVAVQGLTNVKKIAVSPTHACAISGTQVLCWGSNDSGELNGGTPGAPSATPVTVPGVSAIDVAVGLHHSCALTSAAAVMCWGADDRGQLGDGKNGGTTGGMVTVTVTAPTIPLTAGDNHTCVGTSAGGVICWGADDHGQVGNGSVNPAPVAPATVALKSGGGGGGGGGGSTPIATALASSSSHNCALVAIGTNVSAQCWGAGTFGQLGDGLSADESSPTKVVLFGLTQVTVGGSSAGSHSCAYSIGSVAVAGEDPNVTAQGLYCWGANDSGQLGTGATGGRAPSPPLQPSLFTDPSLPVAGLAAGASHTCALLHGGVVECWGDNSAGQIGIGTAGAPVVLPAQVNFLP
jgi:alpha-tubulin suppressor-like RCC1 family protein